MVKVVNLVASTRYIDTLDVNEVAECLGIDYEQEQFPGMVYRSVDPKVCILLFRSGKAVATGAQNIEDIEVAFNRLRTDLDSNGFKLWDDKDCDVSVHNMVVTCDVSDVLGTTKLNLTNLMITLPFAKTEYEPEQFPGLIYRIDDPKVVFLIFSSGRCVITGSKSMDEAEEAEQILRDELMAVASWK
tara:strand:+ start:2477 stop:3037 length:561 start_codon:yes stop_codon:yes gene_type:complete